MNTNPRLVVESQDGSWADEYCIHDGEVQFRHRYRSARNDWKQLTAEDISTHLALRTVVGEWLTLRLLKAAPARMNRPWKTGQRDSHRSY